MRRRIALVMLISMVLLSLAGCNKASYSDVQRSPISSPIESTTDIAYNQSLKDEYVFFVSQRWGHIPFCKTILQGCKDAGDDWSARLGVSVEIVYSDSGTSTPELQNESMKEMAQMGVDGMLLFPGDSELVCDTLIANYNEKNIPVVITDIGINRGEYLSSIITDNYNGGKIAAEVLATSIQKHAKVIVFNNGVNNNNARLRADGFMDRARELGLAALPEKIIELSEENAYEMMESVLLKHPDIAGVFTLNSIPAKGVVEALQDADNGECRVVTFDLDKYVLDAIGKKQIVACVVQDPYYMGYEGINQLFYHFTGQYSMITKEIISPTSTCTYQNYSTYANNPQVKLSDPD